MLAHEILKEITSAKQHCRILDKRSGNAVTENEIGSPRMDSFQRIPAPNPSPLVSWFPPHLAAPVFCVPLRYLPFEENLWQIVLTVGTVPPGARNIPGLAKADAAV